MNDVPMWQRPLRVAPDMTVAALVDELSYSSFGARRVARACQLASRWASNPQLRVIITISGALSIAQQTSIVAQLIGAGKLHAVITTGAVVTHSLTQEAGGRRRSVGPEESDEALAQGGLNRVFDTIESDDNLSLLHALVTELSAAELRGNVGSVDILRALGTSSRLRGEGLVAAAARAEVPIFVPALSDSELGLRLARTVRAGTSWTYDGFADLQRFADWLRRGTDYAILSLGGGVPRNWAQQMFAEVNDHGAGEGPRLVTGIRICPDTEPLGHLSGSTFSEARSWRKIPAYDDRRFVEVPLDFTLVFPLLAISMLQNGAAHGVPLPRRASG
ncbi:MAG TPA: deoxyhypusine synthase family protein [Vicinamibacterales bacterium]|nr:deoxyhypusine synthase family protein [Vicinamibacterales bacterium]